MDENSSAAADPLIECVPNFSEGRDLRTVQAILQAMHLPGVLLLDYRIDPAANRCVVTIAGSPAAVCEAAVRAAGVAADRIDLTRQTGSHPRIGAADVIPFVPIPSLTGSAGSSLLACALLARETAAALWERHSVPSYLYEAAAARPDRVQLDEVRRGQFEGLREAGRRDPGRRPDVGGPGLHPTGGASAVGARHLLVEYSAMLGTSDLGVARTIARELRGDTGGPGSVKASGLLVDGRAAIAMQVSVARPEALAQAHDALVRASHKRKTALTGVKLSGLVPRAAYNAAAEWAEALEGEAGGNSWGARDGAGGIGREEQAHNSGSQVSGEQGSGLRKSDQLDLERSIPESRVLEHRITDPLPWPAQI